MRRIFTFWSFFFWCALTLWRAKGTLKVKSNLSLEKHFKCTIIIILITHFSKIFFAIQPGTKNSCKMCPKSAHFPHSKGSGHKIKSDRYVTSPWYGSKQNHYFLWRTDDDVNGRRERTLQFLVRYFNENNKANIQIWVGSGLEKVAAVIVCLYNNYFK